MAAAVVAGGMGCDFGHECTDIGCETGLEWSVRRASGSWADGDYVLTVGTERCSFSIPRDLPPVGSTTTPVCSEGTRVLLGNSGVGAFLTTTPKTLTIELTLDGAVILSESSTPSYQDSQPNGPDCGPVCRWGGTLDFVVTQ